MSTSPKQFARPISYTSSLEVVVNRTSPKGQSYAVFFPWKSSRRCKSIIFRASSIIESLCSIRNLAIAATSLWATPSEISSFALLRERELRSSEASSSSFNVCCEQVSKKSSDGSVLGTVIPLGLLADKPCKLLTTFQGGSVDLGLAAVRSL